MKWRSQQDSNPATHGVKVRYSKNRFRLLSQDQATTSMSC